MGKLEKLIKKGAEASLFLTDWHNKKVIIKKRLPKKYRLPQSDKQLRVYRTVHEPQLMSEAKKAGVPTPTIFFVNIKTATIIMEYIEGKQIKQLLNQASKNKRKQLCFKVGKLVGKLHKHGIIHGDLTTSNMIQDSLGNIFFLDFGLGEKNKELESRGVDLHLMKQTLLSTHYRFAKECFQAIIQGYSTILDAKTTKDVLDKINEIENRGRYIAERKKQI